MFIFYHVVKEMQLLRLKKRFFKLQKINRTNCLFIIEYCLYKNVKNCFPPLLSYLLRNIPLLEKKMSEIIH